MDPLWFYIASFQPPHAKFDDAKNWKKKNGSIGQTKDVNKKSIGKTKSDAGIVMPRIKPPGFNIGKSISYW